MIVGSVILAGGRSRRMGRPKEALPIGDSTMLGRTVDTLLTCSYPVVVVARDTKQDLPPIALEAEVVFDDQIDQGPLMGMLTGMRAAAGECDAVFVTGCDSPLLEANAIDWLSHQLGEYDLVMAKIEDFCQPLGAIYRTSVIPTIETMLAEGIQTPRTLAERCNARLLSAAEVDTFDPDRRFLTNVNSPEDYDSLRSHFGD